MTVEVQHFFDPRTSTLTYVVFDASSKAGVVVDPVLDFEPASARTSEATLEPVERFIEERQLRIPYILDTHVHADHLTAMALLRERYQAQTVIGREVTRVQEVFAGLYDLGNDLATDGSQFDLLVGDGEELDVGSFAVKAHHAPGHTPACSAWHIADKLFVGDVLFMPDFGTARCDFPGGSAATLYDSVRRLYELPGQTEVYTCHDYQPGGRELRFRSTIEEQRTENKQLTGTTTRDEFIKFREERDAGLGLPNLMLAVLQVNIRAGVLPPAAPNGTSYLKIPLNKF